MKLPFNQKLMLLRKNKNLSQRELAKEIGLGVANITRYENGRIPTASVLVKLSDFFGVSIDYLLKESMDLDNEFNTIFDQVNNLKEDDREVVKNLFLGVMDSYLKKSRK